MRGLRFPIVTGLAGALACMSAARAESLHIRVPADAPTGVPTVIGVGYDIGPSAAGKLAALRHLEVAGLSESAVVAQFVPDLDEAGEPLSRGTVWLPITIAPEQRGRTLRLTLTQMAKPAPPPIRMHVLPKQATQFLEGERLILQYNHGPKDLNGRADPNAVVTSAGYAGMSAEIVDRMRTYRYPDGKCPLDFVEVINVHFYSGQEPPEIC